MALIHAHKSKITNSMGNLAKTQGEFLKSILADNEEEVRGKDLET